jgi:NADH-quinone oxidoreductase subunit C
MSRLIKQIRLFEELLATLQARFPEHDLEGRSVPPDDLFITIPAEGLRPAVRLLLEEFDLTHLSTITGQAREDSIELLYHFWDQHGVTLRVILPNLFDENEAPTIASLTDLIPGAAFYEREIWEMLGVAIEGHPNLKPLLMPDDWEGEHPLRPEAENAEEEEEEEEKEEEAR